MEPESALLGDLLKLIRGLEEPVRVVLFGSASRGDMGPHSDLDVLIIVREGLDTRDIARRIYRSLIGFQVAVDLVVATEADIRDYGDSYSLVYYPALREGRELYAA